MKSGLEAVQQNEKAFDYLPELTLRYVPEKLKKLLVYLTEKTELGGF
jgi:hypothetical protein